LLVAGSALAQGTGRSLDIQPGGRQNGMGAAGVALAEDATGVTWWNPAALGFIERTAVQLTYAKLVPGLADDVSYNYGTYVQPISGFGAYGVGIVFLSYGQSEGRAEDGTFTGNFGSNEFSPALYYGTRILPDFAVGAAVKWIRIQLAPDSRSGIGTTFGLDLAALYRIPGARLNFGVDIYDGQLLVDTINRSRLPAGEFPFVAGYELVSIDDAAEAIDHDEPVAVAIERNTGGRANARNGELQEAGRGRAATIVDVAAVR